MRFEDDEAVNCARCSQMIYPGEIALRWKNHLYCSEDCVRDAIYDDHAGEVDTLAILSAADKMDIAADMYSHEGR